MSGRSVLTFLRFNLLSASFCIIFLSHVIATTINKQILSAFFYYFFYFFFKSCDSSVGIALGYGLDDRGSRVRFPVGARNFSLHHRVQRGSGAHPPSYPTGIRGSFPGGKAAGA
jgi:hypothetical protein